MCDGYVKGNSSDNSRPPKKFTKTKDVQIKLETDCEAEINHMVDDLLGNDSSISEKGQLNEASFMKACSTLRSTPDITKEKHDNLIRPVINPMQQALVERIVDEFYILLDQNWEAQIKKCPGGCLSSSGNGKGRSGSVDRASVPNSQNKRQRIPDQDSGDESNNKKPRRPGGTQQSSGNLNRPARFACPFRKHDPQKYNIHSHRVCALTSWDTIARVK
jgi:hypothetical protein